MGIRTWTIVPAALAVALIASGCDDDNGDETTAAAPTKAQYVQSVKDRCSQYLNERQAAEKPLQQAFGNAEDPSEIPPEELKAGAEQIAALNDTTREVLTDLAELPRPEADQAGLEEVFANFDEGKAALDEADQAAAAGDGAALGASFEDFDKAVDKNGALSDEYGFSVCGGEG